MESQRNGRSQAERREQTKLKLLQATVSCLDEFGIAGIRIADVVARAKVTTGAIQYLFGSREELIVATIDYIFNKNRSNYDDLERSGSLEERLHKLTDLRIRRLQSGYRAYVEMMSYSRTQTALGEKLRASLKSTAKRHEEWFLWYLEDLNLDKDRVIAAKDLLASSYYGQLLFDMYRNDRAHFRKVQSLMIELLLDYLRDS